jgi:pyruvate dehydrogenase E1 component alpha subunit
MHPAVPEYGILGTSAIVGGSIPLGVGTALASRLRRDDCVSVVFFGDGASEEGVFHESLNFASLKKLPVVFVCENNLYATSSHLSARQPHPDIYRKAEGHDIPGRSVDGNDVIAVYAEAKTAIELARSGMGPTLLECKTYRWKGHVGPECDYEKGCRPKEDLFEWMEKCPLKSFKEHLVDRGVIDGDGYDHLVAQTDRKLEDALTAAKESPFPEIDELYQHVYYEKQDN